MGKEAGRDYLFIFGINFWIALNNFSIALITFFYSFDLPYFAAFYITDLNFSATIKDVFIEF